jgi:chromosome partitioning protein
MTTAKRALLVVVANQKGGCGKTTTTMQLAGAWGRAGKRVLVVDADPQGTATRWAACAPDEAAFPATVVGMAAAGGKIHRELAKVLPDYDVVVVDCPPAVDSPVPQSALLVADVVLVPVIPSPPDLWAAVGIRDLVKRMADVNEGLKALLVVNMAQAGTTLSREAADALADFGLPMARSTLGFRQAFRQSAVYGCTVHGMKPVDAKAADEVDALAMEVLALGKVKA